MRQLWSLALITAFVGNALFLADEACGQSASQAPYYTDEQRQRIHAELTHIRPVTHPVARKIENEEDIPPHTLDLDALDVWKRKGWKLSDLLDRCEKEKLTGLCYDGDDGTFHYVDVKDMAALERNYDSLHKALDLPYKTAVHLNDHRRYPMTNNLDGVSANLHVRLDMLRRFSLEALMAIQGHEVAHTHFRHHEASGKDGDRGKHYFSNKRNRNDRSRAEEYASDSLAVSLYGRQFIDALYQLGGAFKGEEKIDFHHGPGQSHPDLGLRIQYAEALLLYQENQADLRKPDHPPVIKNWRPSPSVER
jgi:hypothetical protein